MSADADLANATLRGDVPIYPTATTPVLVTRPLNPTRALTRPSLFGDDRWDLTPALFEAHSTSLRLRFEDLPTAFTQAVKLCVWLLLNHDAPAHLNPSQPGRLSVATVADNLKRLKPFVRWLASRGRARFGDVTSEDLGAYLIAVRETAPTINMRRLLFAEVQRLWALRALLPVDCRLPPAPPWNGVAALALARETVETVGPTQASDAWDADDLGANRTPRIAEATMTTLLGWAVRFIEVFADDITVAWREYCRLCNHNARGRRRGLSPRTQRTRGELRDPLLALLAKYRRSRKPLPGRRDATGTLRLNVYHLARLLDCAETSLGFHRSILAQAVDECGLADGATLHTHVAGRVAGRPWRESPITYEEAPVLARHLSTAAYIVIAYLSGMRPGEALNLRRGCVQRDRVTGLDYVHGKKWKGAVDATGAKNVEGEERDIPWVVVPIVVQAIEALERLHEFPWLFPSSLEVNGRRGVRSAQARTSNKLILDIAAFIAWVNGQCAVWDWVEPIPPDASGRSIHPARLRRTLAWFIWHRPRGAVAAALQYGHLHVRITQGYAGTYASGFPDEYALEDHLGRSSRLHEDARRLREGEHVSGPAADEYRTRVQTAATFTGRAIPIERQARAALGHPSLHVFHGRAMTCVLDPTQALCQLREPDDDARRTPDLDNCRPACHNIARTDRDMAELRNELEGHVAGADDPLAPEPRRLREAVRADQLRQIIDAHESTRIIEPRLPSVEREDERRRTEGTDADDTPHNEPHEEKR